MDESELRTYFRAAQPILQRTAPAASASRIKITPPVLDQIAWSVVLAYVAHASRRPPPSIPQQLKSGEGPLRDEDVQAALDGLRQAEARPVLEPKPAALDRFAAAVRRLLDAYGWTAPRATQAATEMARALAAVTGRR